MWRACYLSSRMSDAHSAAHETLVTGYSRCPGKFQVVTEQNTVLRGVMRGYLCVLFYV